MGTKIITDASEKFLKCQCILEAFGEGTKRQIEYIEYLAFEPRIVLSSELGEMAKFEIPRVHIYYINSYRKEEGKNTLTLDCRLEYLKGQSVNLHITMSSSKPIEMKMLPERVWD